MEYLAIVLTVAAIHLFAVMSPGPDFLMVTRNTLMYSRRTGMYTAVGLGLGILVHVFYSLIGIGLIISQSIMLFTVIKLIGAIYLIYLGYKSLTAKKSKLVIADEETRSDISSLKAIKTGFLTNVMNPKVTLFFLSLFTLVINPQTPLGIKLFMGMEMSLMTMIWFILVAFLVSHHIVKARIQKIQFYAEKFVGALLILLGIKVALATSC